MKKDYMTRLEGWARWMLPRQEAEDVIADYRDITGDPELCRGLDKPRHVIKPLANKKTYYTWLAAFAVMALCVFTLGISPTGIGYLIWRLPFFPNHLGPVFALSGAVLALVWFRRKKDGRRAPIPKGLAVALAFLLVWVGLVFLFYWAVLHDLDGFVSMWGTMTTFIGPGNTVPRSTYLIQCALCYLPFLASFPALYWLVKARIHDRRWAAAYILAVTAILVSLETVAELTNMNVTAAPYEVSLRARLLQCAVVTALGLTGTGVALC